MKMLLSEQTTFDHTQKHLHLAFSAPRTVISSAVLNGGIVQAKHLVNLKVPKYSKTSETPEATILGYCKDAGWSGPTVGMMTAASMDSLRIASERVQGVDIEVLVTSGLSNPRRVGDPAEHRLIATTSTEVGTINIVALTSAVLTMPALVEAVMIATEAKAAALQDFGVISPVSKAIATGTGTDAIAVVTGDGPETVCFCGKHVLFGEILGNLVSSAVTASIDWPQS